MAASGFGMPRGPGCHARGVSRRVSAPWLAGVEGADGTGLRARYPFTDPRAGRAMVFQQNSRLETERSYQPNENTMRIRYYFKKSGCWIAEFMITYRRFQRREKSKVLKVTSMKLIKRERYLDRLADLRGTPDVKIITGVRHAGKSKHSGE